MPIVLEVLSGSRRGQRAVLNQPRVRLGRHPDNDVVFDAPGDAFVSAFHAEILELTARTWKVVDCGSVHGVWLDGRRITEQPLEGKVELRLGENGPRIAVMPLEVIPAQVADAGTWPSKREHEPPPGLDPLVVAPTAEGPLSAFRGPGRLGPALEPSPPRRIVPEPLPTATLGVRAPARLPTPAPIDPDRARSAGPAAPRTTAFIRAVAGEAVRRNSRRFWLAIAVLGTALLGAALFVGLVLAGVVRIGRDEPPAPSSSSTAAAGDGGTASAPLPLVGAKEIAARNADAVFLFGVVAGNRSEGFCTGFAMAHRILATNAHCVVEMQRVWEAVGDGQGVYAFQNEHPGVKLRVLYALMHPDYRSDDSGTIYPDVALAVVEGEMPVRVRLASRERAAELQAGDKIRSLGFPGALNNEASPVATLTEGIVSRMTDLGQRKAPLDASVLIQHSAFTVKGTSGSPLFDETGLVVGINTGYYRGESQQQRVDPVTGRMRDETVTQDLQSYAIGMRVDLLLDLLQLLYERIGGATDPALRVDG